MAILAAEWLTAEKHAAIGEKELKRGIRNAGWPGRFEKVLNKPLVYIDGANNEEMSGWPDESPPTSPGGIFTYASALLKISRTRTSSAKSSRFCVMDSLHMF